MHRGSRCASWQSAYAPREALDSEGEAMLGQALHDHSLPRDYPPPSLPLAELLTFPEGWRCACGIFTGPSHRSKHFPPAP